MKGSKDGCFFVESLYEALDWPSTVPFPYRYIWNSCVLTKVFFLLEKFHWENINFGSVKEEGRALANKCFLCGEDEQTIDQILGHCSKVIISCECDMILALVGLSRSSL